MRLKEYKKALFHYRLTRIFPILSTLFDTDYGFCYYFQILSDDNFTNKNLKEKYPELYEQRPGYGDRHGYWFEKGLKKPRIECLKKAIKLCK